MEFICAQPDQPMFVWQLRLLINSLQKSGVTREKIHLLVLLEPTANPSDGMRALEEVACIYYYDERAEGRYYLPSSKPYLFGRHWERFPHLKNKHFLFVESDMLVYKAPELPVDDTWYWSDASRYLETGRYEHLVGLDQVQGGAFGFHCFGKGSDHNLWYQVESMSQKLYERMQLQGIKANQWICEMRAWMWIWNAHFNNIVDPQLTFNDGYGPRKPGATLYHQLSKKHFRKREYMDGLPIIENNIHPVFCQYDYLQAIVEEGCRIKGDI